MDVPRMGDTLGMARRFAIYVALGVAIFGVDAWLRDDPREIRLGEAERSAIAARFEATYGRAPVDEERRDAERRWFEEEAAVREAVALGLAAHDPVVRRRLVQDMAFLEAGDAIALDDAALAAHLAAHPERFARPARTAFLVVRLRVGTGAGATVDAEAARVALDAGAAPGSIAAPTALGVGPHTMNRSQIAGTFGEEIAGAIDAAPIDAWHGPIATPLGAHLVRVSARRPAETPALDEVREAVEADALGAGGEAAREAALARVAARYRLVRSDG